MSPERVSEFEARRDLVVSTFVRHLRWLFAQPMARVRHEAVSCLLTYHFLTLAKKQ